MLIPTETQVAPMLMSTETRMAPMLLPTETQVDLWNIPFEHVIYDSSPNVNPFKREKGILEDIGLPRFIIMLGFTRISRT